jgi:hypothetical protein
MTFPASSLPRRTQKNTRLLNAGYEARMVRVFLKNIIIMDANRSSTQQLRAACLSAKEKWTGTSRARKARIFAVVWPLAVAFSAFKFGFNPVILLIFAASPYVIAMAAAFFIPPLVYLYIAVRPPVWKMAVLSVLYVVLGLPLTIAVTFLGCGTVGPCGNGLH